MKWAYNNPLRPDPHYVTLEGGYNRRALRAVAPVESYGHIPRKLYDPTRLGFFVRTAEFCNSGNLDKYPESWKGEIFAEKLGDAHSSLTLNLNDSILRVIDEKDNASENLDKT
ncbi:hypothetical protein M9H77_08757 [Catharanthus roseus]|uniref:Uncharacterized protein n=1 Tax=Catharanthus roseus TaxID=4058 RepID=A0ACC0BYV5_CATRO|nr:hypothetical protein M9H77_08757 [Catharanthus roseus]